MKGDKGSGFEIEYWLTIPRDLYTWSAGPGSRMVWCTRQRLYASPQPGSGPEEPNKAALKAFASTFDAAMGFSSGRADLMG